MSANTTIQSMAVCVAVAWLLASAASLTGALAARHRRVAAAPFEYPALAPNFLEPQECDAVINAARRKGLGRSTVLGSQPTKDVRTSRGTFLGPEDDAVVATIYAKVSALLRTPIEQFEKLQVVSYDAGEKYEAHYDACKNCDAAGGDLLRTHTVLMYLTDDFEGGHTVFPTCGVDVTPRRGMAVVWRNLGGGGGGGGGGTSIMESSLHAADPVTSHGPGKKWICTVWSRAQK